MNNGPRHGAYFSQFFASGAVHFMASNNDCGIRDFDMERFQLAKQFSFAWPVNVSASWKCTNEYIEQYECRFFSRTGTKLYDSARDMHKVGYHFSGLLGGTVTFIETCLKKVVIQKLFIGESIKLVHE